MNVALISGGVKQDIWTRTEPMYGRLRPSVGTCCVCSKYYYLEWDQKLPQVVQKATNPFFLFIKYSSPTYVDFFIPP